MLLNKQGQVVAVESLKINKVNRTKKLFDLREVLEPMHHKCGDMFRLGTRAIARLK